MYILNVSTNDYERKISKSSDILYNDFNVTLIENLKDFMFFQCLSN